MSSSYIVNYIKIDDDNIKKRKRGIECEEYNVFDDNKYIKIVIERDNIKREREIKCKKDEICKDNKFIEIFYERGINKR